MIEVILSLISFFLFSTAVYSDQTDTSIEFEPDYSFSSHSSIISDFGEAPLSSTRRSSFFNLSNINGRPSCRRTSYNRLTGPSMLSSTRMSALQPAAGIVEEDDLCANDIVSTSHADTADGRISPSRTDILPAFLSRQTLRKSVSFRDVDEYYPVFSPETAKRQSAVDGSQCTSSLTFDISEYSGFLHSERMATLLPKQGIDVTSPDHVYVFCRESGAEDDLEKTVISRCAFEDSHEEQEGGSVKESKVNMPEQRVCFRVGSSSSGTGSSNYSSCESDHYTSALDSSMHPRQLLLPAVEEASAGTESAKTAVSAGTDSEFAKQDRFLPHVQEETKLDSHPKTIEYLPITLDNPSMPLVEPLNSDQLEAGNGPFDTFDQQLQQHTRSIAIDASEQNCDLSFTPSPFVTGRTHSRLSRCSLRTSKTPESLLFTSSLFEETLPTPLRTRRQTPRTRSRGAFYSSPHAFSSTRPISESGIDGDSLPAECQDAQCSTLRAASSVSISQADTVILPTGVPDFAVESQTLCDTIALENNQENSGDAYERNLAEIILALREQDLAESKEFLTDDLMSADETTTKGEVKDVLNKDQAANLENEDAWITEDCISQAGSGSLSSSSSFSPRRSREDSDLPCTPGTGCTPRYSMSRLSSYRRPQSLANLSYTPGGRPFIQDMDEPVEYLYTDTEQGHKLIETHVPPTADTSLSSSFSTTSSEETILYDWRTLQTDTMSNKGKENQKPQMVEQKEKNDECGNNLLPETRGMTDKELRLRLVELGVSPGPISSRTRPTYMRRLCSMLQEASSQSQHPQKQSEKPQGGNTYANYLT